MIFNALTIAGSDSSAGAGIQADLKTFGALGVYGTSVVTAVTAQNTREVRAIHTLPVEIITAQLDAVFDDIRIDAVKIGMLGRPEIIEAVVRNLDRRQAANVVVDPVMIAKSGDKLLDDNAIAVLRDQLIPRATVITPNLPEAAQILGELPVTEEQAMTGVGERLVKLGASWVVLKGGHLTGDRSPDLLMSAEGSWRFDAPRIDTRNTHGTGCTLSSAIAGLLAHGYAVPEAVERAKSYLHKALSRADLLDVGHGHGPVNHFGELWSCTTEEGKANVDTQ